ncbi:MAG: DUF1127 domain-containing protein [Rhodobacteraceae bacterium]|uniref:DUF1127 domain-containing protein n=1 Tax=Tabrizicola sp. SY72 TaxID=2741673 RepID=UPI001574C51B|nr:DUF1127 domain-containing protein [Tabrizicola sp. SY72]MBL9058197.1 DUF1127 domain-containing protein [Paracoccaceae bacterium]NTT86243.1 DUF1127 domain-containing protein [Tabrizicola sp. SY72]
MFQRIKTLLHRWHDLAEVSALSDRELDDLGMTRDQVERFVRMPADVPDRVVAMGEIFGISAEELKRDHNAWVELLETCGTCRDRGACALVLERGELSRPQDCGFCLNAAAFTAAAS